MAKIYDFKALLNSYEKSPQNRRKNGFSQSSETTMYKRVVKQFVKVLVVLNVVGSSPTGHPR